MLSAYAEGDFYPYHMPGHKRNPRSYEMADFCRIDITEIDGFDNLHQAEGILKEAQERANRFYGTDETHYLVGGSTCGVLAAVFSATRRGEEILIARNCHKSVYHAAIMQELKLRYYCPGQIAEYGICDGVDADEIDRLLTVYPNCKAVVITSPTYEGILSDVGRIAKVVHTRGKILILDEAHGAHLRLEELCRANKASQVENKPAADFGFGAATDLPDLVIHSLHKTLPSMTQTALLHINGGRVDRAKLRSYLTMLQSSSPSYVLMASMDACVRYLEKEGAARLDFFRKQYEKFCKKIEPCHHIRVGKMTDVSQKQYCLAGWDIGKLVISVQGTGMSGQELYDIFRKEYHLQMEMASADFVLAMMTIMDEEEGWQRLADAILQIDDRIEKESVRNIPNKKRRKDAACRKQGREGGDGRLPEAAMEIADAFCSGKEFVPLQSAERYVAADFINLYPPGVPLLVPGEVMDREVLKKIQESLRIGLQIQGLTKDKKVAVVCATEINF